MNKSVKTIILSVVGGLILIVITLSITSFKTGTATEITQDLNIKQNKQKINTNYLLDCGKDEKTNDKIDKQAINDKKERKCILEKMQSYKKTQNKILLQQRESNTLLRLLIEDKKLVYEEK